MKYICVKRFKNSTMYGEINVPALTEVEERDGSLFFGERFLCVARSDNGKHFFSINEDGEGMKRGKLISSIEKKLRQTDKNHQNRWDKIWNDGICLKYRNKAIADFWLWNDDFYKANIYDLKHIARLIDAKC